MDENQQVSDLTLMLIYLTAWEEKVVRDETVLRSWKGYDWDTLNGLEDKGLISGSRRSKSVYLTDEGVARAKELLATLTHQAGNE